MGSADIIPGVSGGTIALITGIYEHLIYAIKSINPRFLIYLVKGFFDRSYFKKAQKIFLGIDFYFLIPLAVGILMAFASLAHVISFFLEFFPGYTYSFFFGLILSSAFFVYRSHKKVIGHMGLFFVLLGTIFGLFIVGLESVNANHSLLIILFSGMISFCAMILPGISGAFILLVLGQYDFMLNVVRDLVVLDFSSFSYAIVYMVGGAIGLLSFSRLLSYLLRRYREVTLGFVLGLMIGALRKPGVYIFENPGNVFLTFIAFLLGFILVGFIAYYGSFYQDINDVGF